jgi:hypothetical protein
MRLYTVLLYFMQTALHVSGDTLIHHQGHIFLNCNYNIWHSLQLNYSLKNVLLMMDEDIIRNM